MGHFFAFIIALVFFNITLDDIGETIRSNLIFNSMVVLITVLISSSTILEYLNQDSRHRSYVERKRLEEYREFAIDIIEKNYQDQIKNPLSEE